MIPEIKSDLMKEIISEFNEDNKEDHMAASLRRNVEMNSVILDAAQKTLMFHDNNLLIHKVGILQSISLQDWSFYNRYLH